MTGCSNKSVNQKSFDSIEKGTTINDVIKILGEPDEVSNYVGLITYHWFDKVKSVDEAIKATKKGKEITFICVYFGKNIKGDYIVEEKTMDVWRNE